MVGYRVVRGPDWQSSDQDGGEGFLGTLVHAKEDQPTVPGTVWVRWDSGISSTCKAGLGGEMELRVFDTCVVGKDHKRVSCDGCDQTPLLGMRWKCLDCPDYDLCTTCYMADEHYLNHKFRRIDSRRDEGVLVGKREDATKIQARGIFPCSRVARESGDSNADGVTREEGTVMKINDWKNQGHKCGITVQWDDSYKEEFYRLGLEEKVILICTKPESGGFYYRDHLPVLVVGFSVGDRVFVHVNTTEELRELTDGHGEWHDNMSKFISTVGEVDRVSISGDVFVKYGEEILQFNSEALTKVPRFEKGDTVSVKNDEQLVTRMQMNHGGWDASMRAMLGKTGNIVGSYDDDSLLELSIDGEVWHVNPAILTLCKEDSNDAQKCNGVPQELGSFLEAALEMAIQELLSKQSNTSDAGESNKNIPEGDLLVKIAARGNLAQVKDILDSKPHLINHFSDDGSTALHTSCHHGRCDVVNLLLERGADVNLLHVGKYLTKTSTEYYSEFQRLEEMRQESQRREEERRDKSGDIVMVFAKHGIKPNNNNNPEENSPLHLAVRQGNEPAVKNLVQKTHCDVNIQDIYGNTPLHDAILWGKNIMVDVILDAAFIDLTICNKQGFNYLHLAALKGNKHAVERLLEKSPELLNIPKEDGSTALHLATINNQHEVAELLLQQPGCPTDARNRKGQTPLLFAVHKGYLTMVQTLVKNGADVNAEDEEGETPLLSALQREKLATAELTEARESHGKMVDNVADKNSSSYAAISEYLLSRGANVHHCDSNGQTPLEMCEGSKVEALIRKRSRESRVEEQDAKEVARDTVENQENSETTIHGTRDGPVGPSESNRDEMESANTTSKHNRDHSEGAVDESEIAREAVKLTTGDDSEQENGDKRKSKADDAVEDKAMRVTAEGSQRKEDSCWTFVDPETHMVFQLRRLKPVCQECSARIKNCYECKAMINDNTKQDG